MANKIKGLTVEIGGDTTKLGKALADVNKKSFNLQQELKEVNKLLKFDPKNPELLAQKQKILAEAIENTKEKLDKLKQAEKQVQKQFERGEVSEDQVRALQREIAQTEQTMDRYEKEAKQAAKATKNVGNEAKEAGDKASKFGDTLKAVGGVAAKGFAAVGTAATAAVTALAGATASAAAYADEILTTSTVTGISTEKLQAYSYAAELVDVSVETLTKSHAKNIKSMKAVQDGTKLAVDAYKTLGVEVMNADGSLRDGETVYWEVINALGEMENETERDALAMQILGKSAQELNPLIEAGAEKMQELTEEAKEVGAVLSDEALAALGEFDDSVQRLKGSAGAAKNALGTVLLPELTKLTQDGGAFLADFTKKLNESGGGLEGFIQTIDTMAPEIGTKLGDLIGGIVNKASELIPAIITVATSLVTTLVTNLVAQFPALVEAGIQAIGAILQGLTSAIPQVVDAVVGMIPQLVEALVAGIPQMIDGAVQFLLAILDAIPLIIPPLVEAIPDIVLAIVNGLIAAIPDLLSGAVTFLLAIVQAIPILIRALLPEIPTIVDTIINGLLENLPLLVDGAVQLLMGIITAIPEIQKAVFENMPRIVSSIVSGLLSAIPELIKAGGQLLSGLVKGMMDFDLLGAISSVGNSIVNGFKSIFDIHSPSRVMAGIGKLLDEGLAEGIEDNAKQPVKALTELSEEMLEGTDAMNGLTLERRLTHTFSPVDTAAPTEGLANKLDRILAAIERGQVLTIDGRALVGATAGQMDQALGKRRALVARGAI